MTLANTPRRDGDAFQARRFWYYAAEMLRSDGVVLRVGFETGPRGFDDLWVEYIPNRGPVDARGNRIVREHIQCKWHASNGEYGFAQLIDPDFINATSTSLLQRAYAAQERHAPSGIGTRFCLLTNWRPTTSDPLAQLINTRSSALRVDTLFSTKTDKSMMGQVRKAWREHLDVDDARLAVLAHTLGFSTVASSPEDVRLNLNDRFMAVGLKPVSISDSTLPHDDIVFQWAAQGLNAWDKDSFREACAFEQLLGPAIPPSRVFGVKSFEHAIDNVEDRCVKVLNLVPSFHERFIKSDADWAVLFPELRQFLLSAARDTSHLRLALDAHATVAFAAGAVLNVKSGCVIELEQRTHGRAVWQTTALPNTSLPSMQTALEDLGTGCPDLVVAVSLTHDIAAAVRSYAQAELPATGFLLSCTVQGGPSQVSVQDGHHAAQLAASMCAAVNATRMPGIARTIHLFVAAPNGFTFMAGQYQPAMGRVTLYEFDFSHERTGSYEPSLTLPLTQRPTMNRS